MTLLTLRARVCCDACGKNYDVEIDPAAKCDSAFSAVEDAMIGGEGSFYDGFMRCDDCTGTYVAQWIADNPTKISSIHQVFADGGWNVETNDGSHYFIAQGNPLGVPQFDREVADYLIASAGPELLAALRRLAFVARTTGGTAGPDADLMAACTLADAVIAKATPSDTHEVG